jgi:ribosomal protein S18 acetylase RimI-like enzyme
MNCIPESTIQKLFTGARNNMEISTATKNDLPEILALQKLAYRSEAEIYNDFGIPPLTQTLEQLAEEADHATILKAVDEGMITGSVRAYEKDGTCFIGRLIVHPDYQGRGFGRRLMGAIEGCFKCGRYELFTGHRSEKNLALYEKLGYKRYKIETVNEALSLIYLEKYKTAH